MLNYKITVVTTHVYQSKIKYRTTCIMKFVLLSITEHLVMGKIHSLSIFENGDDLKYDPFLCFEVLLIPQHGDHCCVIQHENCAASDFFNTVTNSY